MSTCQVCQQPKVEETVIVREDPAGIEPPEVTQIRQQCTCCGYLNIITPETFAVIPSDGKLTLYDTLHANLQCAGEAVETIPDSSLRVRLQTHLQSVSTEVDFLREEVKRAKFEACGWRALHNEQNRIVDEFLTRSAEIKPK